MASIDQETMMKVGAMAIGAVQPFVLRQYADKTYGSLIPQLGVWGTPSALAGIVLGGGATIAALAGMTMGIGIRNPLHQDLLLSYGAPALASTIAMAVSTQVVTATPQAYFAPQAGVQQAGIPSYAPASAAARNYKSLTQPQKNKLSVY